ncbi:MAG: Ribose import ATP-binding protein RbsA [Marmoricola sp.]|nr:Ribose import ATP-binding protein RbsA [Marmoricola sp.]
MTAPPVVELRGIRKAYPGVVASDDVDLQVRAGEVLGLVGKNGAGKSTIIKMLAGLIQPDDGQILVDGETVVLRTPQDASRRGLAFVHQELELVPRLSVGENVFLGIGYPKRGLVRWGALHDQANELLTRLGASCTSEEKVEDLTVAQKRVVMLARGIAQDARLIVLDEPTASLTETEIKQLFVVIDRLRARGIALVYVSHRLEEVLELTDRVVVMRDGRVVDEDITAELTRPQLVTKITGGTGVGSEGAVVSRRTGRRDPGVEILRLDHVATGTHLSDVSFSVRRGEILGLAGLVGSGRTEVARALFGVDRLTSGAVLMDGKPIKLRSPAEALQHGIVMLPEERKTLGNVIELPIQDNVTLPTLRRYRRVKGIPVPSRRRERLDVDQMIARLGIKTDSSRKQVRLLSGGNQQKVVLAKWLLHGAEVFVFDEPTHGIDVQGKEDVYAVMDELAAQGKAVVFISSEFAELLGVCDRLVVLREGVSVTELEGEGIDEELVLQHCYPGEHSA